ncbi:MAG: hypothetical protein IJC39_02895 [Firmicutes bacterium]|nr:hypothetical protein [Bacillota bacterium]
MDRESYASLDNAVKKIMDEALTARMADTIRPEWARWRIGIYEENIRKFRTAMEQYLDGLKV